MDQNTLISAAIIVAAVLLIAIKWWQKGSPATPEADPRYMDRGAREHYINENITRHAEESFPDNLGLRWTVLGFDHDERTTLVEVEPTPDEVGYSRFQFVYSFYAGEEPKVIACYSLEGSRYTLLFTSRGIKEELPKVL